jgi:hypothetical protein
MAAGGAVVVDMVAGGRPVVHSVDLDLARCRLGFLDILPLSSLDFNLHRFLMWCFLMN